jgi:hypothetical protein
MCEPSKPSTRTNFRAYSTLELLRTFDTFEPTKSTLRANVRTIIDIRAVTNPRYRSSNLISRYIRIFNFKIKSSKLGNRAIIDFRTVTNFRCLRTHDTYESTLLTIPTNPKLGPPCIRCLPFDTNRLQIDAARSEYDRDVRLAMPQRTIVHVQSTC